MKLRICQNIYYFRLFMLQSDCFPFVIEEELITSSFCRILGCSILQSFSQHATILEGQSWALDCFCHRDVFFLENCHRSIFTTLAKNQWLTDYQIPLIVIARQSKFQRLWALVTAQIGPDKKSGQDDINDEALFHCTVYGVTNNLCCAFFLLLQINISFV